MGNSISRRAPPASVPGSSGPDVSKNITVTGQIEADFEGNFSHADNRNVSTIRSNALQLRLAYGRIDWTAAPNTDLFFEAGQDWTIFGSSALMNLFETTFFGAYWGNIYERSPQFRIGAGAEIRRLTELEALSGVCHHDAV